MEEDVHGLCYANAVDVAEDAQGDEREGRAAERSTEVSTLWHARIGVDKDALVDEIAYTAPMYGPCTIEHAWRKSSAGPRTMGT